MDGPLKGIRVLELCKTIAGPYCASLFGDMGADVIKVEVPDGGDDFRKSGLVIKGESYYFFMVNRSKRSMTLNLKTEKGKGILLDLVRRADVFIQNLRPGAVERLGVDYESLRKVNPRLVYCSISGFGQDGPYKDRAGYDLVLQAMGGIMSVTGELGRDPTYVGVPLVDLSTALFSFSAILSCLIAREKTGQGQHIDASLYDAAIATLMQLAGRYFGTGEIPRPGEKQDVHVPYGVFKAKDGLFVLEALSPGTWRRLCLTLGLDDFAADPRFQTTAGRGQHKNTIMSKLREIFQREAVDHWLNLLQKNGVPAGPINNMEQVFHDPQALHRKMLIEVEHRKLGPIKLIGVPVKFSSYEASVRRPPPLLGQDTEEILAELGHGRSEIEALRRDGVV